MGACYYGWIGAGGAEKLIIIAPKTMRDVSTYQAHLPGLGVDYFDANEKIEEGGEGEHDSARQHRGVTATGVRDVAAHPS